MSNNFKDLFVKSYLSFFTLIEKILPSLLLLAFRAHWGWQFYLSGKGKLENHSNVVEFFTTLGIPAPNIQAWFVSGLECFGGLLLLVGLFSRPISLLLTVNMIVAYLSVEEDRAKVFNIWNDTDAFLQADPFFFLLASILVLAFGPGFISLDYLIKRFWKRENKKNG